MVSLWAFASCGVSRALPVWLGDPTVVLCEDEGLLGGPLPSPAVFAFVFWLLPCAAVPPWLEAPRSPGFESWSTSERSPGVTIGLGEPVDGALELPGVLVGPWSVGGTCLPLIWVNPAGCPPACPVCHLPRSPWVMLSVEVLPDMGIKLGLFWPILKKVIGYS